MRKWPRPQLMLVATLAVIAAATTSCEPEKNAGTVIKSSGGITALAFSPDGKFLATGHSGGSIRIWDAAKWSEIKTLKGHSENVTSLVFSPDSLSLASGGDEDRVLIWKLESAKIGATIKDDFKAISSLSFAKNGALLVCEANAGPTVIWDLKSNKELSRLVKYEGADTPGLAISPDGKILVTATFGDPNPRQWDISMGRELGKFTGNDSTKSFFCVSLSSDGKKLATGTWQHKILLWDVTNRKKTHEFDAAPRPIGAIAFSPNGEMLASAEGGGQAQEAKPRLALWEAATGKEISHCTNTSAGFKAIAFSPDGKNVVGGSLDGTILVWPVKRP